MMEAARTSESLVNFYQTTRHYNPEDSHLRTHRRENLKSFLCFCLRLTSFSPLISTYTVAISVVHSTWQETGEFQALVPVSRHFQQFPNSKNTLGIQWWPKCPPRYGLVIIKMLLPSLRARERVRQLQELLLVPPLLFLRPQFHSKPSQHH
jgi:hypothetical protein